MELLIRLLNTGKTYRVRESCLVPRREPEKLGLLYAVGAAWCLSPVVPSTPLLHNGTPLTRGCVLAVGDELVAGSERWQVEEVPPNESTPASAPPRCRVTVLGGVQVVTQRELVLGSERRCSLVLSGEGVQPLHALLTPLAGRWTLHALSSAGLDDPDRGKVKSLDVTPGARVLIGQERLVFGFVTELHGADAAPQPDTTYTPDSHYGTVLVTEAPVVLLLAAARGSDDPVLVRCGEILTKLLSGELQPAVRTTFLGRLGGLFNWSKATDEDTLNRLQNDLATGPTNADAWLRLAKFLERRDYFDLCRIVLEQMLGRQLANDPVVVALIRLYILLGRDGTRSSAERLVFCRRADRLAGRILQRSPQRSEIANLRRTAASERSILENHLAAHRG